MLSTGHGSGGPGDYTLAAIIPTSTANRAPHREELKHTKRLLPLWEEAEEDMALLELPPRGFPSSDSKSIIPCAIAELTPDSQGLAEEDTA